MIDENHNRLKIIKQDGDGQVMYVHKFHPYEPLIDVVIGNTYIRLTKEEALAVAHRLLYLAGIRGEDY